MLVWLVLKQASGNSPQTHLKHRQDWMSLELTSKSYSDLQRRLQLGLNKHLQELQKIKSPDTCPPHIEHKVEDLH